MKRNNGVILFLSAIILFASGCVSEPGLDKGKFSELNRTVQDLKAIITSDKPCDMPDTLVQRLASGIAAVKDRTTSKADRDLVVAYSDLLTIYQDGTLLCKSRSLLSEFQFVPKGRIYVSQQLDPIVEKYGLSTEKHLYKPTGQYWKSVSADSIKVIWENAETRTKYIENTFKYN